LGGEGISGEQRMMGRREDGQGQFFYSFDLDEVVPPDHLVRQIDGLLDLRILRRSPFQFPDRRPSILVFMTFHS
jgi:hypothetical protein